MGKLKGIMTERKFHISLTYICPYELDLLYGSLMFVIIIKLMSVKFGFLFTLLIIVLVTVISCVYAVYRSFIRSLGVTLHVTSSAAFTTYEKVTINKITPQFCNHACVVLTLYFESPLRMAFINFNNVTVCLFPYTLCLSGFKRHPEFHSVFIGVKTGAISKLFG